MAEHRITSREIVLQYLVRIATYEDKLHAIITVNGKALEDAEFSRTSGQRNRNRLKLYEEKKPLRVPPRSPREP